MKPIIEVRNLSKIYQIGAKSERYISLRDRLSSPSQWFRTNKTEPFYALKDVSFDIMPGETVGIIGRNGAGKSTLLKILSRITPPTSGSIKLRGRVASLLEVGTGFHPELTGRENIYFNGAILGMRKSEINRKLDEIIDFSGVEQFLDTPLKQYSSGMQLRLAFAVAAHLEPEILLIDEVLAVGDAEFQKKCLGKMEDISKGEGRTVVVVSHDMGMVGKLCDTGILINLNNTYELGAINFIINNYISAHQKNEFYFKGKLSRYLKLLEFIINKKVISQGISIEGDDEIIIELVFQNISFLKPFRITCSISSYNVRLFSMHDIPLKCSIGKFKSIFKIPSKLLRDGYYDVGVGGHSKDTENEWFWNENLGRFKVEKYYDAQIDVMNKGYINVNYLSFREENDS